MSACETWDWPPEHAAALARLAEIMIPNPNAGKPIKITEMMRDGQSEALELGTREVPAQA